MNSDKFLFKIFSRMGVQNSNTNNYTKIAEIIQQYKQDNDPTEILPYLYLGGKSIKQNTVLLNILNIKNALNVAHDVDLGKNLLDTPGIRIIHIKTKDIRADFEKCFALIDSVRFSNQKILIFCKNGRSRSFTIVAAYLMSRYRMSLAMAFNFIQQKRPVVEPRINFIEILEEYEKELILKPFIA